MGYVIQEFLSHLINFHLIRNILLQFIIGRLQFGNGVLQLTGHFVKIIPQHIDLISRLALISCLEIKICHLTGKLGQLRNRLGQPSGHRHHTHSAYNNNDNSYKEIKFIGNVRTLLNAFQGTSNQEIIAIVKLSPAFHIVHSHKTIVHLLNHAVICFFQGFALAVVHIQVTGIAEKQLASQLILIFRPAQIPGVVLVDQYPGQIVSGAGLDNFRGQ